MKNNNRDSGIELLRILTMLGVILLHYNDGRAFKYVAAGSAHELSLFLLESMAICAVDLFVLISGYFLSGTQKRTVLKPLELIAELIVVDLAFYIGKTLFGNTSFQLTEMLKCFIPSNYFVILYSALYFISPYINLCIKKLSTRQFFGLVATLLLLFSVWNTLVDLGEEILGREQLGLSTITAWGSKQGFNIANFVLLYVCGAFLWSYPLPDKLRSKRVLATVWVGTTLCIFGWALLCSRLKLTELRSAWVYHNPLVILSAASLFLLFRELHFHSKIVNLLAAGSFTCFLVHGKLLNYIGIKSAVQASLPFMLLHILVALPLIYGISWIVYFIYHFSTEWLMKRLRKFRIFQNITIPSERGEGTV